MTAGITAVMGRIAEITGGVISVAQQSPGFAGLLAAQVEADAPSANMPPAYPTHATQSAASNGTLPWAAWQWMPSIERAAREEGVDPKLLTALVWTESGFSPTAVSPAGAIGLTQLMPPTADALGVNPYDPEQNLRGGARFLREMIDRFGRVDHALAAYNAGPTRTAATLAAGENLTVGSGYAQTVLDRYHALGGTR